MKINIHNLKEKFVVEVDNLEITVEELKKRLESVMGESVRIPAENQTIIFESKKLEDTKKLSEYVKSGFEEVKMFVIKHQKAQNPISRTHGMQQGEGDQQRMSSQPSYGGNPYANFGQTSMNPPYNAGFAPPYGGYGSPQLGMFGQMPYPGYGSPQPGMFGQMPYQHNSPYSGGGQFHQGDWNNEAFSNIVMQQMEQMLSNPGALDQVLSMHGQNLSPEQREEQKRMLKDALSMVKSNPGIFKQVLTPERINWALNNMNYGGMPFPQHPHAGGNTNQGNVQSIPCSHGFYPPVYSNGRPEPQTYEQVFSRQLTQLRDMGFVDDEANIDALKKANGDINVALDFLYGGRK